MITIVNEEKRWRGVSKNLQTLVGFKVFLILLFGNANFEKTVRSIPNNIMLIDSNILIYSADPNHRFLRELIKQDAPVVSIVSYIEVLGYEKLRDVQRQYFEEFFDATIVLPVNEDVAKQAILFRRQRKIFLGDSIIAATALIYHHTLVTRNVEDFKWIPELKLLNPFE